jgi:hypothetical protein
VALAVRAILEWLGRKWRFSGASLTGASIGALVGVVTTMFLNRNLTLSRWNHLLVDVPDASLGRFWQLVPLVGIAFALIGASLGRRQNKKTAMRLSLFTFAVALAGEARAEDPCLALMTGDASARQRCISSEIAKLGDRGVSMAAVQMLGGTCATVNQAAEGRFEGREDCSRQGKCGGRARPNRIKASRDRRRGSRPYGRSQGRGPPCAAPGERGAGQDRLTREGSHARVGSRASRCRSRRPRAGGLRHRKHQKGDSPG